MNLAGLGKLYSIMYDDRMDIYRTGAELEEDDTTNISYDPTPLYVDIACRLSFSSDDTASDTEVDHTPVRFNPKLFCRAEVDLKAGDFVVVRRYADNGSAARIYRGQVAQPSWYPTHQEAFLRIDEGA